MHRAPIMQRACFLVVKQNVTILNNTIEDKGFGHIISISKQYVLMFTQCKVSKDIHLLPERTQDVSDQAHPRKRCTLGLADLSVNAPSTLVIDTCANYLVQNLSDC